MTGYSPVSKCVPILSEFGLRVTGSELGFRVTGYGFRVTGYGLRVTGSEFGLRVTGSELRVTGYGFRVWVTGCEYVLRILDF